MASASAPRQRLVSSTARTLALVTILGLGLLAASPRAAQATEVTDVMDSFEPDHPFGGSVRLRFDTDGREANIAREVKCLANDALGSGSCARSGIYLAKELKYKQRRNTMSIDTRFGLYKDLELYAYFPIVLSDTWQHEFAPGVSSGNSTVFPVYNKEVLFAVPFNSRTHSGFGDMTLGLKFSPFNYYRDSTEPTWVFGFDAVLPTGTIMKADNDAVGRGLFELHVYTTISRRALTMFEPFFNVHGVYKLAASDSLFDTPDPLGTQPYKHPGYQIGTQFGLVMLPWEDIGQDRRVEIELGSGLDYIARGRDYSEIWEALASPNNPCQGDIGCTNTQHSKSDADPATGQHTRSNGITDIEAHGRLAGWAALHYQPVKNFQISTRLTFMRETAHFITFGEYGKDLDASGNVDQTNTRGENEFSPVYLPSVDSPGQRLRVLDISNLVFMVSVSGKL